MLGVATPLFLTVKLHKDTPVATGELTQAADNTVLGFCLPSRRR
jgi:hypothetical protein